jgi:dynactin 1
MRITIEDLEALKEMNDELEEGHVETEKQLQAELGGFDASSTQFRLLLTRLFETLDALEMRLQTELRNVQVLKDAVTERDSTIAQFRELVQSQAESVSQLFTS